MGGVWHCFNHITTNDKWEVLVFMHRWLLGKCPHLGFWFAWGVPLGIPDTDNQGKDNVTSCSAEVPTENVWSLSGPSKKKMKWRRCNHAKHEPAWIDKWTFRAKWPAVCRQWYQRWRHKNCRGGPELAYFWHQFEDRSRAQGHFQKTSPAIVSPENSEVFFSKKKRIATVQS